VPNPNKARGAKSQLNLRRGGPGRKKVKPEDKEVRRISRALVLNKEYQANLKDRMVSGKIQPGVEVAIWQYAFGKPKEEIDLKAPVPVRLVHEYTE